MYQTTILWLCVMRPYERTNEHDTKRFTFRNNCTMWQYTENTGRRFESSQCNVYVGIWDGWNRIVHTSAFATFWNVRLVCAICMCVSAVCIVNVAFIHGTIRLQCRFFTRTVSRYYFRVVFSFTFCLCASFVYRYIYIYVYYIPFVYCFDCEVTPTHQWIRFNCVLLLLFAEARDTI